ncbi:hypothetical protein [Sulfurovum sp.]|jgi:uncharacterized repeat protein (TIGR01451 family)|uniref:hypothetical protein n=1 Tax=Sulfurovum sp. TaxID=1969726 RepID=UPI002A369F5A|nr:hypothetical protein [Sulfurovum sp.]MDD2450517.1 hypothetical protein [Sulfurovum sp.]MDD3499021.1 hypothetical protein [Sulfurovum sp.]MDY0403370.1 hypothetical protein [Sulfurovum sp.]
MRKGLLYLCLSVLLTSVMHAEISITSESLQEKRINKQLKWVKATKVIPGTKIRYLNTVSNTGEQAAEDLVITNPVPKHMQYLEGSAKCAGACTITYSLDGKVFKAPDKLFVTEMGKKRKARASEYKAVKWVIERLGAKQRSSVQFDAVLE